MDNGVKHDILRSLYTPYNQNPPLSLTETGVQSGTNSETNTSGNFREASSIIDHPSILPQFSYDPNSPDNKRSGTGITQVWRGHNAGGMRPTSTIFTRHILERPQPRVKYVTIKYYNYPPKSSQTEAGSRFHQGFSQVWPPENPHKPYNEAKDHRVYSAKTAGDKTFWKYSDSSFLGGYWRTLLPTPRGHYTGYSEANELTAVGVPSTSNRIQSSKFLSFSSQTAPHAPSIGKTSDASIIKSPEKLTPSITDFFQGMNSVSSDKTQRYKKAKSNLFKDSQTSLHGRETTKRVSGDGARIFSTTPHEQEPSAAQGHSGLSSNLRRFQQSHQKDPTKEVQYPPINTPLYHTDVAHRDAQTHSLTKDPLVTTVSSIAQTPTQFSSYPASGIPLERFAPKDHADSLHSYDPSSEKPVVERQIIKATKGFMRDYKPAQSTKSLYGFRGFENPTRRAVKEPAILSSSDGNGNKGNEIIKSNMHSSFSPMYSFGLRGTTTIATTTAKPEMTPTYSLSPSPGILHITQTTTVSTPGSFSSGFQEVWSESNTHTDVKQTRRQFRVSKRMYGLKGFSSRPLEGAEALVREPDKSDAFQQDFEGFELRSSQIWQPKSSRIHRWYDQTGRTEQGSSKISTRSQNKPQSKDLKPLVKAAGSVESAKPSRFSPDKYKKNHKTYVFLGFQPLQNRNGNANGEKHWNRTNTEQNPTTASPTPKVSSAYLTSAGGLPAEASLKSEPGTASDGKPVAKQARLLNISTSSMVRGRRRKKLNESVSLSNNATSVAVVRPPNHSFSVKAVTYTDILGSASFSGVIVTTQAPTTTTTADKDSSPNTTAEQKEGEQESGGNTSASPEANAEDNVEDFSSVEEKKQSVRGEEADRGMETFDAFLDNEGSRKEHFNHVFFATNTSESQALSEDISELNYLQKSTGNVSFKSMKLSHLDKR